MFFFCMVLELMLHTIYKRSMKRGKVVKRIGIICILLCLADCSNATSAVNVNMYNEDGDMIGTAALSEGKDAVEIELKVEGIDSGFHGVHIHELPKCKGPEFKSAGNHLNPEDKQHGLMNEKGSHLGDLPNVKADDKGMINAELTLPKATLKEGKTSLLQNNGTSLVITKGIDDGRSQPSGKSGKRIACGVIQEEKQRTNDKGSPTDPTESEDNTEEEE